MKTTLIGLKHIKGESKRTGKSFDMTIACLTAPMQDRDIENGSKGLDVRTPAVPDRYRDLLTDSAIGKDFEIEFYFAGGRENIGYAAPLNAK